jgi:hypothetical protein
MNIDKFLENTKQSKSNILFTIPKQDKKDDAPLDGLMDPNFKATSCGISKAAAKQSKSDWSKK